MPDRYDVIAGGGLAGLTAAYAFQLAGADGWTVIERELRPGGHARSIQIDGYTFDYGPHILFTTDTFIEELIRDLLAENLYEQERQAFIYHHEHAIYTRFPFQAHLHGLPVNLVHECLADLVEAVAGRARGDFSPSNYEEWMRGTFGDAISERLMIPYRSLEALAGRARVTWLDERHALVAAVPPEEWSGIVRKARPLAC